MVCLVIKKLLILVSCGFNLELLWRDALRDDSRLEQPNKFLAGRSDTSGVATQVAAKHEEHVSSVECEHLMDS